MGKGRAPCCDKSKVKRGPWSPAEDLKLITFIQHHGHDNWRALPRQAGILRCGKSCRLRWINYLRPDLKRGNFTKEEEEMIIRLHADLGNKWSMIASNFPGRTDNEIKNVWNTHLKKRVATSRSIESARDESKESSITSYSLSSADSASNSQDKEKSTCHQQLRKQASAKAVEQDSLQQVSNKNDGTNMELKESSSSVSYHSDITNTTSQFEHHRTVTYSGAYTVNNTTEEVNKPDISDFEDVMELPLESDIDFWAMLESMGSSQSDEVQLGDLTVSQELSYFGECFDHEESNRKWLQYLEHELGLQTVSTEDIIQDQYQADDADSLFHRNLNRSP